MDGYGAAIDQRLFATLDVCTAGLITDHRLSIRRTDDVWLVVVLFIICDYRHLSEQF